MPILFVIGALAAIAVTANLSDSSGGNSLASSITTDLELFLGVVVVIFLAAILYVIFLK